MPRATLSFILPDEQEEFQLAQDAGKLNCALTDIRDQIRKWRKYQDCTSVNIEELQQFFNDTLNENGVEL
jgi:hypothetical protein